MFSFRKSLILLACFFGLLFLRPVFCQAAIFYLDSKADTYHLGDTFIVELKIDTQGDYINTVQIDLNFSTDILEVQDLSEGNSILTLWVKNPEFINNSISFIGGTPGGYNGPDGLIGKIIFKVKTANKNNAQVVFNNNSSALLNNGKGTKAFLSTRGVVFNILSEKLEKPENEWQENLAQDKVSPQSFKVELSQNPLIFDGKYFITFSTTDKQTGIDHYEVKEGKNDWEKVSSPYVLKNQNLMGSVLVKAVDKAGNYWIENFKLPFKWTWSEAIYIGVIILALILILVILKRVKNKQKNP